MMKSKASAAKFGNPSSQDDLSSGSDLSNSDDAHLSKTTTSSSSSSPQRSYDSMVMAIKSPTLKYTSLRDILPASPPPSPAPATMTPVATTAIHGSSWSEIPITIRDPLVKQAALAYLQPMVSRPELEEEGLFAKFKEVCCGSKCGCIAWFNGVVLEAVRDVFGKRREEEEEEEDVGGEDADDDADEDDDDDRDEYDIEV